jgi:hypothetical protein
MRLAYEHQVADSVNATRLSGGDLSAHDDEERRKDHQGRQKSQ